MKLTAKQKKFAELFVQYGNASKAATEAGYSAKYANTNASKLLQNTTIQKYIDQLMADDEQRRIMDATEAVQLLTSIARGEVTETVVVGTPAGLRETEKEPGIKDRIAATKEILKRYPINQRNKELEDMTLRKLVAETEMAEAEAKQIKGDTEPNPLQIAISKNLMRLRPDYVGVDDETND